MTYMGVVPVEELEKGGHARATTSPARSPATTSTLFKKGREVYLLDTPDGKVFVMQSWTNFKQQGRDGGQPQGIWAASSTLPPGWKFRSVVLDRDLIVQPEADRTTWPR